jgi:hypothetical protein
MTSEEGDATKASTRAIILKAKNNKHMENSLKITNLSAIQLHICITDLWLTL